jgi:alkylhydroperoxidase family enzyme
MIGRPVREPLTGEPGVGVVRLRFDFRSGSFCASISEAYRRPPMTTQTAPRVRPLDPPYEPEVAETLRRMMPAGVEPLKLFRTIAHNHPILERFRKTGAYILNFGTVEPPDREIVIHRTTARNGCEYEWGVHVVAYGRPLGFTEEQLRATVHGTAEDPAFTERQALLVRLVDELHDTGTVSDALWSRLAAVWDSGQLVELVATVGFYHLVSFAANALGVEPEDYAQRFPA